MESSQRGSIGVALVLIGIGILFLVINLTPGLDFGDIWPIIFFLIALGFCLPLLIWPAERRGLAGLLVPASIMFVLGAIFLYCSLTDDWGIWAYAWTLIPASVGLGLALAARVGGWGRDTLRVGVWLMVGSLAALAAFGALLGGPAMQTIGSLMLIAAGVILLFLTWRRPSSTA